MVHFNRDIKNVSTLIKKINSCIEEHILINTDIYIEEVKIYHQIDEQAKQTEQYEIIVKFSFVIKDIFARILKQITIKKDEYEDFMKELYKDCDLTEKEKERLMYNEKTMEEVIYGLISDCISSFVYRLEEKNKEKLLNNIVVN